ncbi:MAG: hypothetical protein RMJ67_07740 [Elusimicrobiota bacterium]|nr:hypothetical protein [Endomicrobiia bacterium]MDW8166384.1 hypothetical protein [Elusimicrobiota bacterium]
MDEEIIITINKDNFSIQIDMVGYQGQTCITDIEEIQKLLNATTISERIKDDYFDVKKVGHVGRKNKF